MRRNKNLKVRALLAIAVCGLLVFGPSNRAEADKSDNVLRIGLERGVRYLDRFVGASRENLLVQLLIDDGLVDMEDGKLAFKPLLASAFKKIDEQTFEVTLRKGAKFHDGSPVTIDDVVYTYRFVKNRSSKVRYSRRLRRWLRSIRKIDSDRAQIKMRKDYPLALRDMAISIPIRKKGSYDDPDQGVLDRFRQANRPIGTGPYRVVEFVPRKLVVLKRFESYYGGSPKGKPVFDKIIFRTIEDEDARLEALVQRKIDWVSDLSPALAEGERSNVRLRYVTGPNMRIGFLNLDAMGKSGKGNPLTNLKVRQALNHAIDRQKLVKRFMGGTSEIIAAACHPAQFGCPSGIRKYDYDPKKARQLLREAGYEDGFSFHLWAYREFDVADAIVDDLAKINVIATVTQSTSRKIGHNRKRGNVAAYFGTWGSGGTADAAAIAGSFWSVGTSKNMSDDQLVAVHMAAAERTSDKTVRGEAYRRGFERIAEQAYWVPLFSYSNHYLLSNELVFEPPKDGLVRFYKLRWR